MSAAILSSQVLSLKLTLERIEDDPTYSRMQREAVAIAGQHLRRLTKKLLAVELIHASPIVLRR